MRSYLQLIGKRDHRGQTQDGFELFGKRADVDGSVGSAAMTFDPLN